jgi:hypothetical protein
MRVSDAGVRSGRARLAGASFFGVQVGDEFAIVPSGRAEELWPDSIGQLTVDEVGSQYAEGPLTLRPGRERVPLDARALRTSASGPAFPVGLPPGAPADLAAAVTASAALRAVGPEDRWMATVLVGAQGELTVADRLGPLHPPRRPGFPAVTAVLRDLRALAQASALLRSVSDGPAAQARLDADVEVVWGVVRAGAQHPMPNSGAVVGVGEDFYIEVRNNGAGILFVSLVDVGVSGYIAILTEDRSGEFVAPGRAYRFGGPLGWPDGLDQGAARPETVLVLVSAGPHDISSLEQAGVGGPTRIAVFEQGGPAGGIEVHRVEFELEAVRQ